MTVAEEYHLFALYSKEGLAQQLPSPLKEKGGIKTAFKS